MLEFTAYVYNVLINASLMIVACVLIKLIVETWSSIFK